MKERLGEREDGRNRKEETEKKREGGNEKGTDKGDEQEQGEQCGGWEDLFHYP